MRGKIRSHTAVVRARRCGGGAATRNFPQAFEENSRKNGP
ncbi:hypothetical protein C7S16_1327 [Burkholderia thailandensis]|uniref:Uncharacterized protein n=1 Tax=Burkholderia thailandensis TaxID=57975 RepID=A0AAW9CX98_BURTH|nr:hypothetical protein [Burkholderia thailandensis]MDW9255127.1 hypothetical protein [Burkholderia thailandensis]